MFVLPFAAFFIGLCFYAILSSFDRKNFGSICGILLSVIFFYVIIRGMKNAILYFTPREECYVEDGNLIYRRIFISKFIFKELRIPLLDIKDIIDKGSKIPKVSTRSLVLATFFTPYERIVIEMKSGKEYRIFVDADPYTFRNDDDNKFIRTYNKLKEMVIEEQNKLSLRSSFYDNYNRKR